MHALLRLSRHIDRLNDRVGGVAAWLTLLMVAAGAYNAVARYLGRWLGASLGSNAWIEAQWYMFSLLFLLGAAHTLKRDEHVRVDVLYGRLSKRAKAFIDLAGTLLLMLPFCALALWLTVPSVVHSFQVREGSPDPGGLPRYPLKAVLLLSFALLFIQGLSIAIKKVAVIRGMDVPDDKDDKGDGAPEQAQ